MSTARRIVIVISVLVLALGMGVQSRAQSKTQGLTEQQLTTLFKTFQLDVISEQEVIAKIQQAGVAFPAGDEVLVRLKQAGATEAILQAVKTAGNSKLAPSLQQAVSYDDIKNLLEAKVPEDRIFALLRKSPTNFVFGADQERELKGLGASGRLIAALKGDRAAPDEPLGDLAILLDCSGSMKGQTTDGNQKMAAAKKVVTDLIESIPEHLNVTLLIFGHETTDPCSVKVVRPVGPMDGSAKRQLTSLIANLQPAGKTPIARALRTAGRELAPRDANCGLILISDGKETCKGDPTAEAAALAANLKVTFGVNVIGFDVNDEEREALDEIAEAGGGKYFNARNTDEFSEAIEEVQKQIQRVARPGRTEEIVLDLGGTPGKAGGYFHDAGLIERGQEYSGNLEMMQAHFYQIPVAKGEQLRAIAQVQKAPYVAQGLNNDPENNNQTFSITIYDRALKQVAHAPVVVQGRPNTPATPRAVWAAPQDTIAFVVVAASDNHTPDGQPQIITSKPEPSKYKLSVRITGARESEPRVQPVLRREVMPGNNYATAGEIVAPGIATTDIKLGEVLFFKTTVSEGERLRVTVAPTKPWYDVVGIYLKPENYAAAYTVSIYDDDQVKVAEKKLSIAINPPHPHSVIADWNVELRGTAWITVSLENSGNRLHNSEEHRKIGLLDEQGNPLPAYLAVQVTKPDSEGAEEESNPFAGAEAGNQ